MTLPEDPASIALRQGEIEKYLRVLETDFSNRELPAGVILQNLNSLKSLIISRNIAGIFIRNERLKTLCHYAFDLDEAEIVISTVAMTCLANILLLESQTRQIFADAGYASNIAKELRENQAKELLCSRILFLLTYDTNLNFDELVENFDVASSIHKNVGLHATQYIEHQRLLSHPDQIPIDNLRPTALTETLKLLFNLIKLFPKNVPSFTKTISPILEILASIKFEPQGLQPPVTQLINVLLNLDLPGPTTPDSIESRNYTPLFPSPSTTNPHNRLIEILDLAIRTTEEDHLESVVPLATLLRRIYELAPPDIKTSMQQSLLPSNDERAKPLGQSDTLPSHLLRVTISPLAPNLRESISCLLFELSSKDATTFVRNVGYGYAAGFLMTHSLPVPEDSLGTSEDPGAQIMSVDGREINPITGQRRDMEPEDELPEMTDEEKEREAERLFVLFERLKATGVMEVVNPVEQAQREGRFEDVEEDDKSEEHET